MSYLLKIHFDVEFQLNYKLHM